MNRVLAVAGYIRNNRFAHVLLLVAVGAFGIWAYLTFGTVYSPPWQCSAINPARDTLPPNPCFRATLSADNQVTLEWRVSNGGDQVYIFDTIGPSYDDVGYLPAHCPDSSGGSCTHKLRVPRGGLYRWTLQVRSSARSRDDRRLYASTSLRVPPPSPLRIDSYDPFVDVLAPESRTVTWSTDEDREAGGASYDAGWVEVRRRAMNARRITELPLYGPEAQLVIPREQLSEPGVSIYELSYCYLPAASETKFCSDHVNVGFYTGADYFKGPHYQSVEPGDVVELGFTSRSGDVRKLELESRGAGLSRPLVTTDAGSFSLDTAGLAMGLHSVSLTSCLADTLRCANTIDSIESDKAGFIVHMPPGHYQENEPVALFFPQDGSAGEAIRTPSSGLVTFTTGSVYAKVEAGETIALVSGAPSDQTHVQVGAGVQWEVGRDYRQDFEAGRAHRVYGSGAPLDITYDKSGGLWLINEFSSSFEHISRKGVVETMEVPLARVSREGALNMNPARPFGIYFAGVESRTHITSLAERVTNIGSKIWFTQGGGMLGDYADVRNHSRLGVFDPAGKDLDTTLHDDRFCMYNVPADDPYGYGNNQVIGLTESGGRIWFAEIRGPFQARPSVISSFIPRDDLCGNELDFENPEAITQQALKYCTEFTNPEQDGCVQRFSLADQPEGIKVAHLERDPIDGSIWFTDAHGRFLGNLDPDRKGGIELHAIPDNHSEPFDGMPIFGGFPWSIRVDGDAVYFSEYATHHLLRFDKATGTFTELHVPCTSPQIRLHSIDIDHSARRLWFTITNEVLVPLDQKGSTVGYVDLDDWRAYANGEAAISDIHGVIYRGLDTIHLPEHEDGMPYAFRGISVNPGTGSVALATMLRASVIELKPHSGFWP